MLDAESARREQRRLAEVLADCVEGGASVSFMWPFSVDDAAAWWVGVLDSVAADKTILFGAYRDDVLVGTVQLGLDGPCNQRHRGDVKKLLVHRSGRGQGVAGRLLSSLEDEARRRNLCLLTLDTVTGSTAERLYARLGWTKAGVIPNYALFPDGAFCDTTIFWKAV
nr:GNAT family N-acetyltransferase [Microvirga antarctica]